ncbi:Myosin-1 [Dissostichus eleginoides]|uniref:Myosin-1 n=1 Tax=Dissostichus eleginoides TaxID=100907 RepID=A0AAD9FLX1_DISEL|nr:Myosin-1 [Dissostichus eleginoides]
MVWDCALLLSRLSKSTVTIAVRPDKKRPRPPYASTPRAGTKCDAAIHKPVGYQPHCANTPSAGASLLRDAPLGFVPCPACAPAAVICSGPGSRNKRGTEGLDWGRGAAQIHFRTVKDHHCLPSHSVTYYYQTTGRHHVHFCV